jgi:hypothetical protein
LFAQILEEKAVALFVQILKEKAVACVKSTCYNMCKVNYTVNVISDCITSYDKRKIVEMLRYYESKGCNLIELNKLFVQSQS